jgi:peptide/nickel transport system substrate-binding protein
MDVRMSHRKLTRRASLRLMAGGTVGLIAAACTPNIPTAASPAGSTTSASTRSPVPRGGTLTARATTDPTQLDPQIAASGSDLPYLRAIHDTLVGYDGKGVVRPELSLAESWDTSDPRRIKFTLRSGIKFHDGTPFDAEAVKFNILRTQDPKTGSAARQDVLSITQVDVLDSKTVVFQLDKPNAALLTLLGDRGGMMSSPTAVQKLADKIGRNPSGTGPFKFVEWVQNDHVLLERNPDYWRKDSSGAPLPYLDRLQFKIIPNPTVAQTALETGTVDYASVPPTEWDRVASENKLKTVDFSGTGTELVFVNWSIPPLDNVNFRRALTWSIDRAARNKVINASKNLVGKTFIPPSQWPYVPEVADSPGFDLQKARQFLDASGVPPAARTFELGVQTDNPQRVQDGQFLQESWRQIGVDCKLKLVTVADALQQVWGAKPTLASFASGFGIRSDPDGSVRNMFHSSGFFNGSKKDVMDSLIDKAVSSYDLATRKAAYLEIENQIARDVLTLLWGYSVVRHGFTKRVQNTDTFLLGNGDPQFVSLAVSP